MTALIASIADTVTERPRKPKFTASTRNTGDECVGRRLLLWRASFGMSEEELCQKLEIDPNDLNAYEQGTKRIGANLLLRIAKLLHVGPDYFFHGYTPEELSACLN
jgi:ribosome-binding protein aMBF1 (putative translation factor)